jgi:DoxX-like family
MSSTAKKVSYWVTTGLVVFFIGGGGLSQIWQYKVNPHGVVPLLGYPMYFFAILGFWKFFGALTILAPGFPRLKEWAYAGIFFDLTGAAASCAAVGGYGAYGFHVIAPLIIAGLLMASWALRPESRVVGVVIPSKSGLGGAAKI